MRPLIIHHPFFIRWITAIHRCIAGAEGAGLSRFLLAFGLQQPLYLHLFKVRPSVVAVTERGEAMQMEPNLQDMKIFFFALFNVVLLASCRTQKEVITNYLERSNDTTGINLLRLTEPTIQKNDLLSIKVYSLSADPQVDALYNLPEQTVAGSSTTTGTAGFLVTDAGDIEYPRLGTFHVEGLKKSELAQQIKTKLDSILKSPTVIVRFLNYKITVLGEVRAPGTFNVPTERVTIFEALGLAGDVTEYGNKATVKIWRETNGQAVIQRLKT